MKSGFSKAEKVFTEFSLGITGQAYAGRLSANRHPQVNVILILKKTRKS